MNYYEQALSSQGIKPNVSEQVSLPWLTTISIFKPMANNIASTNLFPHVTPNNLIYKQIFHLVQFEWTSRRQFTVITRPVGRSTVFDRYTGRERVRGILLEFSLVEAN